MINGLDIERFRTTMAAVENDHAKGKAALRAKFALGIRHKERNLRASLPSLYHRRTEKHGR